jgi:hypothetical protein
MPSKPLEGRNTLLVFATNRLIIYYHCSYFSASPYVLKKLQLFYGQHPQFVKYGTTSNFSLLGGPNAPAAGEPEIYVTLSARPHH